MNGRRSSAARRRHRRRARAIGGARTGATNVAAQRLGTLGADPQLRTSFHDRYTSRKEPYSSVLTLF